MTNQMIVFLETAIVSHILLSLSRGSHNLLICVCLSVYLYGDHGILSHGKKVVKLFSAILLKEVLPSH